MFRLLLGSARWTVALSVLAGALSGLSSAAVIVLINEALERDTRSVLMLGWGFVALCLAMLLTRVVSAVLVMRLGQSAVLDLRLRLSRMILGAPLPQLQELGSPRLLANLTEDIDSIAESLVALPTICIEGAMVVGCIAYLGWLSPPLLGMVFVLVLVGGVGFHVAQTRAFAAFRASRDHDDALFAHFRALMDGVKELKLHRRRRDAFFSQVLEPTAAACKRHFSRGVAIYILAANAGNGLFYLALGVVLFLLPQTHVVSEEVLRGYTLTILYLMMPLTSVLDALPTMAQAHVAFEKVDRIGRELRPERADEEQASVPGHPAAAAVRIDLVDVTHRYGADGPEAGFQLGPVNLALRPGELVFVIGGNGSGKTTLALVLLGLYAPDSGQVLIDGQPVDDAGREAYREHFSAVFADFFLFDRLLGLDAKGVDQRARRLLHRLRLAEVVSIEHGEFSTTRLSQGQRKRLALLTAFLEDRPVYVFDEWAADQEPRFKEFFYQVLLPRLRSRGKTVLVITHDDQYLAVADRCLKLEHGRIVDARVGDSREADRRNVRRRG